MNWLWSLRIVFDWKNAMSKQNFMCVHCVRKNDRGHKMEGVNQQMCPKFELKPLQSKVCTSKEARLMWLVWRNHKNGVKYTALHRILKLVWTLQKICYSGDLQRSQFERLKHRNNKSHRFARQLNRLVTVIVHHLLITPRFETRRLLMKMLRRDVRRFSLAKWKSLNSTKVRFYWRTCGFYIVECKLWSRAFRR